MSRTQPLKIINPKLDEDYHVHSLNFSDGLNTVDELVMFAQKIGLKKLVITDHSSAAGFLVQSGRRTALYRWKNVHNDVNVEFGVEADLLNAKGDICDTIKGACADFIILSVHPNVYEDDFSTITQGLCNALDRFGEKIHCLGHIYTAWLAPHIDCPKIIKKANKYNIVCEINGSYVDTTRCDETLFMQVLDHADTIVFTSDAHCLADLRDFRQRAFKAVQRRGYID